MKEPRQSFGDLARSQLPSRSEHVAPAISKHKSALQLLRSLQPVEENPLLPSHREHSFDNIIQKFEGSKYNNQPGPSKFSMHTERAKPSLHRQKLQGNFVGLPQVIRRGEKSKENECPVPDDNYDSFCPTAQRS